jgi:hypothetical protein
MPNQYLPGVTTIPSQLLILGISQTNPMVVTTVLPTIGMQANTYIVGMAIKLFVPATYKMWQANGIICTIKEIIAGTFPQFVTNVDSSGFDTFFIPSSSVESPASISPAGSRNLQFDNNTSKAPFQSLNNIGN